LNKVKINDPAAVAKKYPHEISGGMAQRVAIALALSGNPKILIADEPTTALDVSVQKEILNLLESIQQESGMSILLVSHDWGVVSELCERAVVMYAGQVVEQATVKEITFKSKHPYSRGLMKANPHFAKPGERLITIPGAVPPPAEWPVGCHFKARCPIATDECGIKAIPMIEVGANHLTRCVHSDRTEQIEATK
jgi:peptide/nickel transport system permease protein